ncbi:MAG: hypothetical protein JXR59_05930 [Desulfuromonadaceae bacterium]|nr:hypothetical protein [Desulfuromonadaceae bacterium]
MRGGFWIRAGFGLLLWLSVLICPAWSEEGSRYRVIVHSQQQINTLNQSTIQRLFLGKMKRWPEGLPVEVAINTIEPVSSEFCREILCRTPNQLSVYWRRALYTGSAMLPVFYNSDEEVCAYVANHAGAIGFVSVACDPLSVRTVEVQP